MKHNVPLVGDRILKVRKFQNAVKEASEQKEISIRRIFLKNTKRRGWFYFDRIWELEGKSCQLTIGNNDKSFKVHMIRNETDFYSLNQK